MAENTWMSTIIGADFSEEATWTMRAISLLASLPILCMLITFQYSIKSLLLWSSSSAGRVSSSHQNDDDDPTSCKGEHVTREDDDQILQCVICLCDVCKGEKFRVLEECSHGFHVECLDAWLMQKSTCPLCRCSVAYSPAGKKKQQQLWNSEEEDDDDQEAYYETLIASFLSFLDHLWTWFLNPLGFDSSCQDFHAYL